MNARDNDASTTQRRTMRPQRIDGAGHVPACLVVLQGQRLGQRIDLGDNPLVIGRSPEAEFQILERSVSREHCRIWREPAGYRIKDLDSTNKTFLNDQPIIEAELKDGDHISIGSCVLKFMDRSSVEARYHEEIYQLATADPLTDLYNRRQFTELLEKELARAANHKRPLVLLIVDIDHFKSINDRYGHPSGDIVLKKVALTLRGLSREEFITARIGGEEFAVVLPEHALEQAVGFAERLREGIAGLSLALTGGPQRVTVSIGAAAWADGMSGSSDLMRAADAELYRAKQAGRNRVSSALTV
ncbi:MAG TPA: GGDEF domain-containing protein [Dokdonella sp.]|uniref:GGDEF domain-containing protein n=1 Tax=Dokdonella sp. TaxID=2291710 RepID=UPI0025C21912|nr:GGDEF domain-containing protein [Dokdonella sp.]MBX3691137.1 GGDEF domain-containing protein [Dokdonella sp.]MCW5566883.1 GGDEF domain-containing protein [Dokdonella sp.]HNR91687.1 GGDEF domain-containing protein [Dokdonella sp.]